MNSTIPLFSLVIPCYNESLGLPELIRRCAFVASEGGGEVILVDNGSSDGTRELLTRELGAEAGQSRSGVVRWVTVPQNLGYGFGIRAGLAEATAPVVGWTHADLQTDPADVLRAMDAFNVDTPVFVKGRRYGRPAADQFFTAGMSFFESVLLGTNLRDINAQPTLFSRALLEDWGTPPDDFSLDLFALYKARRSGFRIRRFPVIFAPRKWGSSTWNTDLSSKFRFIKRTLDYSLRLRRSL